jgi:hypothetical protein
MIANCKGIWCLEHCGHCGYVNTVYPTAINGVACTREECKQLFEEIRQYDQRAAVDNTPDSTP